MCKIGPFSRIFTLRRPPLGVLCRCRGFPGMQRSEGGSFDSAGLRFGPSTLRAVWCITAAWSVGYDSRLGGRGYGQDAPRWRRFAEETPGRSLGRAVAGRGGSGKLDAMDRAITTTPSGTGHHGKQKRPRSSSRGVCAGASVLLWDTAASVTGQRWRLASACRCPPAGRPRPI